MATGVPFMGSNIVLKGAEGSGVLDIHAFTDRNEFITCWRLTPEEMERVKRTGEVWLSVWTAPDRVPPVKVSGMPLLKIVDPETGDIGEYYTDGTHVVLAAMEFAIKHHAGQSYNTEGKAADGSPVLHERPYTYHLGQVVNVIDEFKDILGLDWQYLAAAWLHDFIEDCIPDISYEERYEMLRVMFGEFVAELVWACTGRTHINGEFQNRKARGAEQAAKIRAFPKAAILKVADRIANMQASIDFDNESKGGMYVKEADAFFDKVVVLAPEPLQQRYLDVVSALKEKFPKANRK